MKCSSLFLAVILIALSGTVFAQGRMEKTPTVGQVFDRFGNPYDLSDIRVNGTGAPGRAPGKTIGSTVNSVNVDQLFCTAGYFQLYYTPGSFFDGNTAAQTVMCELFTNLSGFIQSPLSAPGNTTYVKILCSTYTGTMNVLALGTAYYVVPSPAVSNNGIVESEIYKLITSGVDGFANLPNNTFVNVSQGSAYYHGSILVKPGTQWNQSLSTSASSSDFDLYSVMLHEATHVLGFATLIGSTGASVFTGTNIYLNYYSSYDKFLHTAAGVPLISAAQPSCPTSNVSFTVGASNLAPGTCPNPNPDLSNCTSAIRYISPNAGTIKVYTPDCFEQGSSLCHFEDYCTTPGSFTASGTCYSAAGNSNNNLYYNMSNANNAGPCYIKRYLKEEERFVLCDLGYAVAATYTSNAASASYTYAGGACPGKNIWGVNDGWAGGAYTFTTTASSMSIPVSQLTANDATTAVQISCTEAIYGNATAVVSGPNLVITPTVGYTGLVIVKYIPVTSLGVMGNPTYVYAYFVPAGCNSPGTCNLVQNGGFENVSFGLPCGYILGAGNNVLIYPYFTILSCWESYQGTMDLFTRNCTGNPSFRLGLDVYGTTIDSYNGTPNDRVIGMVMSQPNAMSAPYTEAMKNNLSTPLQPNVTYQVSFLASNYSGNLSIMGASNQNYQPRVVTIASAPAFAAPGIPNYPAGLNILAQFTLSPTSNTAAPWTAYTQTFVFTPTVAHSAFFIGGNTAATYSMLGYFDMSYIFFDEVSIVPVPTPTFAIPGATTCANNSFTNLQQYATGTGTFTGAGITQSLGQYHFNSPAVLPPGNYPVAYTSASGTCLTTVWQNIIVSQAFTASAVSSAPNCSTYNGTITLNASASPGTGFTYSWQPGSLAGAQVSVSPASTTVYTLTAYDPANCISTATVAAVVPTNCCNSPGLPVFTGTSVSGSPAFVGPRLIANSFTIQAGSTLMLNGEIMMAPGVTITVESGAQLILIGAHVYACGGSMWGGVVVLNGGKVITQPYGGKTNMVEDAQIAFSVSNYTVGGITVLDLNNVVFNKNRVSVDITNYTLSLAAAPFKITDCVFTCRDFTFSPAQWPQSTTADLRSAGNPTTGLVAPYLMQGAAVTNLKSPYSSDRSHAAIRLSGVGTSQTVSPTSTAYTYNSIEIGTTSGMTPADRVLIFDAHEYFIKASASNLAVRNCVFQNTETFIVSSSPTVGCAIEFVNTTLNGKLDLLSGSFDLGCRFWDCHKAVNSTNAYELVVEKAIFRSTQASTALTTPSFMSKGMEALGLTTNRIESYRIQKNEFTNINNCVKIAYTHGTFQVNSLNFTGPSYLSELSINTNTFSPFTNTTFNGSSTQYVRNAITVTDPLLLIRCKAGSPGITITNNLMYRVFNGISLNGLTMRYGSHNAGAPKMVATNTITLDEDNIWYVSQAGIEYLNTEVEIQSGTYGFESIERNTLTLRGANLANTNVKLMYFYNNIGWGWAAPYIICNTLTSAYAGFVFETQAGPAYWRGNQMNNLARGMMLLNGGYLGNQGGSTAPSDNQWQNTWLGTNYGTYVDANSDASLSKLYVKTGSPWNPANSFGAAPVNKRYSFAPNIPTATGNYVCGGSYNQRSVPIPLPEEENYSSAALHYIAKDWTYRYLAHNETLRENDATLSDYYTAMAGSTHELFKKMEDHLNEEKLDEARQLLATLDGARLTSVESNYRKFYQLYFSYREARMTEENLAELETLAGLCPGDNGAVVFRARALYALVKGVTFNGPRACMEEDRNTLTLLDKNEKQERGQLKVLPNPNSGKFTITSRQQHEQLRIVIHDVTGKQVYASDALIRDFSLDLNVALPNGLYFITISSEGQEVLKQKMVVSGN